LILDLADAAGVRVTNLSLQKLVFFSHAYFLAERGLALVDEPFEAWQYGPVSRTLYLCFRDLEAQPIDVRATAIDPLRLTVRELAHIVDETVIGYLTSIFSFFGRLPAGALVDLSHEQGSPWSAVWKNGEHCPNLGMQIPNDLIQSYYSQMPRPIRNHGNANEKRPTRH
jgi:uncharacterized phage-associated protein